MVKILVVEDDERLAQAVCQKLRQADYDVECVYDGIAAIEIAEREIFDVIVLDIMLPNIDGIKVVKELREKEIQSSIIMVTAKNSISDRVLGLDAGADDYLAKPFAPNELIARIRALTRRQSVFGYDGRLSIGNLVCDQDMKTLSTPTDTVSLTGKEMELISLFLSNPSNVYSKEDIINKVWDGDDSVNGNNVEAYISFLRKKLDFLHATVTIKTFRKVGYKLELDKS